MADTRPAPFRKFKNTEGAIRVAPGTRFIFPSGLVWTREPLGIDVFIGPVSIDCQKRLVDRLAQRTAFADDKTNLVGLEYRADDLQHALAALRGQVLKGRRIENDGLHLALCEHSDSLVGVRHARKRQSKPSQIIAGNGSRRGGNRLAWQVSRATNLGLEARYDLRRRYRRRELGDEDDTQQPHGDDRNPLDHARGFTVAILARRDNQHGSPQPFTDRREVTL